MSPYRSEISMAASSCHIVLAVVPLFTVIVDGAAPEFVPRLYYQSLSRCSVQIDEN